MFYPVAISILCVLGWLVWKTSKSENEILACLQGLLPFHFLATPHLIPTTGLANK